MKEFIWELLFIVSFAIGIIFILFGLYEQVAGPAKAEKLLRKLHIPFSYHLIFAIGLICVSTATLLYLFRGKLR